MSKPAVLCISLDRIKHIRNGFDIQEQDLHFINRNVVDAEDITIGSLLPQIIPSVAVQSPDGKFITYARNGNERRLHGNRSLTIGGHIDITDMAYHSMRDTIIDAANREVREEIGIRSYLDLDDFKEVIYLPVDNVSKVHVGLFTIMPIKDTNLIIPDDELYDVRFVGKEQLLKDIALYEAWSQHIIKNLI